MVRNRVSDQVLFAQAKNNLTLRAGKGLKDELKSDGNYSAVEIVLMMVPVSFFFFKDFEMLFQAAENEVS